MEDKELMMMIPVREYRELIEGKVSAEKDYEHDRFEKYKLMDEVRELKDMIARMKGDDLK